MREMKKCCLRLFEDPKPAAFPAGLIHTHKLSRGKESGKMTGGAKTDGPGKTADFSRRTNFNPLNFHSFTLIEMLVVIAVIVILSALLLPALGKAKGKAETLLCACNLNQTGKIIQLYSNDYNEWIIPGWSDSSSYWPEMIYLESRGTPAPSRAGFLYCPTALSRYNAYDSNYGYKSWYSYNLKIMGLSGAPLSPVRKLSKILRHSQVPTLAEAQDRAVYGGSTAQHWMDFTPGERLNGPHSGYIMNILFLDGHTGSYIFSSPIAYARLNAGDGNPDMDYVAILR